MEDLIEFGTLTPKAGQFLEACVRGKLNVLISGGTGSGKTTTLNVLSAAIPDDERIITVEDAAELQLSQEHVITLETRPPTSRARARSRSATSSATPSGCAPTASSSASVVAPRRSTCSRR